MTDTVPAIHPLDPMLDAFAEQYALRERFLHALQMIAVLKPNGKAFKDALAMAQEIAREAMDDETIEAWKLAGWQTPWLDAADEDGGEAAAMVQAVIDEARGVLHSGDE